MLRSIPMQLFAQPQFTEVQTLRYWPLRSFAARSTPCPIITLQKHLKPRSVIARTKHGRLAAVFRARTGHAAATLPGILRTLSQDCRQTAHVRGVLRGSACGAPDRISGHAGGPYFETAGRRLSAIYRSLVRSIIPALSTALSLLRHRAPGYASAWNRRIPSPCQ